MPRSAWLFTQISPVNYIYALNTFLFAILRKSMVYSLANYYSHGVFRIDNVRLDGGIIHATKDLAQATLAQRWHGLRFSSGQ
jgi:hypothetical protein